MNPLKGTNGQLMVMAAHRYCLGRRSYIVGACQEWLKAHWDEFERNTQNVIVRDTIGALIDEDAGDDCDVQSWKHFAGWAWDEIDTPSRRWVKRAVAHKQKPWPLTPPNTPPPSPSL